MPSNPPNAPDPYRHPVQYAAHERAHGRQPPAWTDEAVHDMESTSRLREQVRIANEKADRFLAQRDDAEATNEDLRDQLAVARLALDFSAVDLKAAKAEADVRLDSERVEWTKREGCEAIMREVAEQLRGQRETWCFDLADRLDPPPVAEKPLHAYFPSDVNAGSRSPCAHCGQAYDAHVPPPVVENPPNTP